MLRLPQVGQASYPTSIRQTVLPVSTASRVVLPSGNETSRQHPSTQRGRCRHCGARLVHTFVDLGMSPLCESFLDADQLDEMEPFYPLHVYVCDQCFLVQLPEYVSPEAIFREYAYFSSYSDTWLDHARAYTDHVIERFQLNRDNWVVEIASNDGYLLQWFVARGIPVQGIEPAANVAQVAIRKGVPTWVQFFGREMARRVAASGRRGDPLIGDNVPAPIPQPHHFVAGFRILLAPRGVITMEFPHLMRLVAGNQFDTIYHEHFSYFSLLAVERLFAAHQLVVFDVQELKTHGGSLRIYVRHLEDSSKPIGQRVSELRADEEAAGLGHLHYYSAFEASVQETKRHLLAFLIEAKRLGRTIVGYGAPGKGNTLLNYCGIRTDFLGYTVDRSPYKQGKFLPGTHIPIFAPEKIRATRPDYLLILPWNLKEEIMEQTAYIRDWGGQFIVPIPEPRVYR